MSMSRHLWLTPSRSEKQGKAIQSPARRLTCQSDKLPFLIQRTSLHGRAKQLLEKGEESMGKIPYLFRPSPVFFVVCCPEFEGLCFPQSKTTSQQVERSKASGTLPLLLFVLINCLQSPSVSQLCMEKFSGSAFPLASSIIPVNQKQLRANCPVFH